MEEIVLCIAFLFLVLSLLSYIPVYFRKPGVEGWAGATMLGSKIFLSCAGISLLLFALGGILYG